MPWLLALTFAALWALTVTTCANISPLLSAELRAGRAHNRLASCLKDGPPRACDEERRVAEAAAHAYMLLLTNRGARP